MLGRYSLPPSDFQGSVKLDQGGFPAAGAAAAAAAAAAGAAGLLLPRPGSQNVALLRAAWLVKARPWRLQECQKILAMMLRAASFTLLL